MLDKVNNYYLDNFSGLSFEKQFHYASRLSLWSASPHPTLLAFLQNAKLQFCGNGDLDAFDAILRKLKQSPSAAFGAKHAAKERAMYFEALPLLRPSCSLLFRLLSARSVYGIDARVLLQNHFDIAQLEQIQSRLLSDPEALTTLSTHAINFLYLFNLFYQEDEVGFSVDELVRIWQTQYKLDNPTQLLLAVYFLTHCIIGETLFYARKIPTQKLNQYRSIASKLDKLLAQYFDVITLDNKFEILLCFALCGLQTTHIQAIMHEASQSFSPDGAFLVDTVNHAPRADTTSFEASEHRNVLFIMANTSTKLAPT